jgi:hypothetical protein
MGSGLLILLREKTFRHPDVAKSSKPAINQTLLYFPTTQRTPSVNYCRFDGLDKEKDTGRRNVRGVGALVLLLVANFLTEIVTCRIAESLDLVRDQ